MVNTFFISDTHFSHTNILTFLNPDGSRLRSFDSIQEHDEHMVECWNKTVRPQDKVYHLGDVVIHRRSLPILSRLNGHKRLVRGNHDVFTTKDFMKYFEEIYGVRVINNLIFSHIPIHSDSMNRFRANVHGHLHSNKVMLDGEIDPRYLCVSCEQVDYTPISLDEVNKRINEQQEQS